MGANSFITACKNRQKSIIKVFLNSKKIDINERDDMGRTGLFYSCGEGDREIVKLLIEAGADVNLGDNNSITPLHKLFKNGGDKIADMTELLMENGADPNSKNIDGETPLMLLSNIWREEEGIEALEILENYNVDISITNNKGETALDTALKMKKEKLAQYLMNIGG